MLLLKERLKTKGGDYEEPGDKSFGFRRSLLRRLFPLGRRRDVMVKVRKIA